MEKEDFQTALDYANTFLEDHPKNHLIIYNKARALIGLKKHDKAVESLQTCIRYNPSFYAAHKKLGLLVASAGEYTKAALCLNMAIYHNFSKANNTYVIGNLESIYEQDIKDIRKCFFLVFSLFMRYSIILS